MKTNEYKMITINTAKFFIEGSEIDEFLKALHLYKIKYDIDIVRMTEEEYKQIMLLENDIL